MPKRVIWLPLWPRSLRNKPIKLSMKNLLDEDVEILQQGELLQRRVEGQSYGLSFSYKY